MGGRSRSQEWRRQRRVVVLRRLVAAPGAAPPSLMLPCVTRCARRHMPAARQTRRRCRRPPPLLASLHLGPAAGRCWPLSYGSIYCTHLHVLMCRWTRGRPSLTSPASLATRGGLKRQPVTGSSRRLRLAGCAAWGRTRTCKLSTCLDRLGCAWVPRTGPNRAHAWFARAHSSKLWLHLCWAAQQPAHAEQREAEGWLRVVVSGPLPRAAAGGNIAPPPSPAPRLAWPQALHLGHA